MKYIGFKLRRYIMKSFDSIQKEFFYNGVLRAFMSTAYDLSFSIFLSISRFSRRARSGVIQISQYLSLLALGLYLFILMQCCMVMFRDKITLKDRKHKNKFGSLYENIKLTSNKLGLLYNPLLLLKKLLFMYFLVMLYSEPVIQIVAISSLSSVFAIYLIICKPFEQKIQLRKEIQSEVLLFLCEIMIILYSVDDSVLYFNEDERVLIGWAVVALITIILIL